MKTTTILAMAVLGCCCLVSDAYAIGSPYISNRHSALVANRRQIPGFGRAIIYDPTNAPRGRAAKATQVRQVAPTPEAPRAQPAQRAEPHAQQAKRVHPPAQSQNVHPQAPTRYQPTIIIIREDAPRPRGAASIAQGPAVSAPASPTSVYDQASSQSSLDPYSAPGYNLADPLYDLFPADPFFDHSIPSADPFAYSRHADPFDVPAPASAAQRRVSPQVHTPEPNSQAGPDPFYGGSQHGYDALDTMMRLSMLAEMDLPHFAEPHNLHRQVQTHGTPGSQGTAQPPASKSPEKAPSTYLNAQNKYDQLYAKHLAEALDLPFPQGQQMPGATSSTNPQSPADSPNAAAAQAPAAAPAAAEAAPEQAAELAASPVDRAAASSAGGSGGYHPYDLYSLHLREALDLPPMMPLPHV